MSGAGKLIIGLSGQAGSGKSTLARFLADRLNGETASFGDFVRYLASEQGLSAERQSLQEIGEAAVRGDADAFVADFIAWATPSPERVLIVDGIRHIVIDQAMRTWASGMGRSYVSVVVTAAEEVRAKRRTMGDREALAALDSHPVELESATALPAVADIIVKEDWAADTMLGAILEAAARQRG